MLELITNSEAKSTTSMPIQWCVSKNTIDELEKEGVTNPHLLAVVVHGGCAVERKLIPLGQVMEFFDFHRAGDHRICSAIVWQTEGDIRILRARIFGGRAHGIQYDRCKLLDEEGNLLLVGEHFETAGVKFADEAEITISVHKEHFAEPPSKFEKWWVNLWHEKPPRDKCVFRKRRFRAYSIQPFVVLAYLTLLTIMRGIVAAWYLSLAKRGINLRPLIHPWNYDTDDIYFHTENKGTIFTKDGKGHETGLLVLLFPFTPIVGEIVFMFLCALNYGRSLGYSILAVAFASIGVQAVLSALITAVCIIGATAGYIRERLAVSLKQLNAMPKFQWMITWASAIKEIFLAGFILLIITGILTAIVSVILVLVLKIAWWNAVVTAFISMMKIMLITGALLITIKLVDAAVASITRRRAARQKQPRRMKEKLMEEYKGYQELLCDFRPTKVSVAALPKTKRTYYLLYKDLKVKLCKQYAIE